MGLGERMNAVQEVNPAERRGSPSPGPRTAGRRRRNSLPPSIFKFPGIQKETPANRLVFLFAMCKQYRCRCQIIKRPFWAAPRVRRKFGAQGRIAHCRRSGVSERNRPQGGSWWGDGAALPAPSNFDLRRVPAAFGRRNPKRKTRHRRVFLFGGPNRDRTDDLTDANRTLSQGGKFSAHGLRCMV